MKTKILKILMILVTATACVFVAASFAGQTAKYASEQEGKHVFLVQAKEDMNALRSCLMPLYRPAAKPDLTSGAPLVSEVMPSAKMVPSLVQPDSTAIAAAPRAEITTVAGDNR